jgi:carbon storage regulator CsrA
MLVLSRKLDERIQIGDDIVITVVRISAAAVRIGIDAPPNLSVLRGELLKPCDGDEPARKLVDGVLAEA